MEIPAGPNPNPHQFRLRFLAPPWLCLPGVAGPGGLVSWLTDREGARGSPAGDGVGRGKQNISKVWILLSLGAEGDSVPHPFPESIFVEVFFLVSRLKATYDSVVTAVCV